jgi:hypothetical protein
MRVFALLWAWLAAKLGSSYEECNVSKTRLRFVSNDTRPRSIFTIRDKDGDALDVSSATVRLKMRPMGQTALKANVICSKLSGLTADDGTIDHSAPYDVPGVGGRIRVDWGQEDLDTPGRFEAEIEITFSDGSIQTIYDRIPIEIRKDF